MEDEDVTCDICESTLLMACEDCISLFCYGCGLRCDCDAFPIKPDIATAIDALPSTFGELMVSEGIYEVRSADGRTLFIPVS